MRPRRTAVEPSERAVETAASAAPATSTSERWSVGRSIDLEPQATSMEPGSIHARTTHTHTLSLIHSQRFLVCRVQRTRRFASTPDLVTDKQTYVHRFSKARRMIFVVALANTCTPRFSRFFSYRAGFQRKFSIPILKSSYFTLSMLLYTTFESCKIKTLCKSQSSVSRLRNLYLSHCQMCGRQPSVKICGKAYSSNQETMHDVSERN